MAGRLPKPAIVRQMDGDTRNVGPRKFQAQIAGALMARRGAPEAPDWLKFAPESIPKNEDIDEKKARLQRDRLARKRLGWARQHWDYLVDALLADGLMAELDGGVLATAALAYAQMVEAGVQGSASAFAATSQRYLQVSDRMGLSESARAKFSKPASTSDSLDEMMCG